MSECGVNSITKRSGVNSKRVPDMRGKPADPKQVDAPTERDRSEAPNETVMPETARQHKGMPASKTVAWYYRALKLERARNPGERTDWGFVVPVWIAIILFCIIVQVGLFLALKSLF